MLHAIQSIDPVYLLALPLFAHGRYIERRRQIGRARAMRRHPSAR